MIDAHAHVAFRQFDDDRAAVIARARVAGVRWLEVGTDIVQSRAALALADAYPYDVIGATVGVHPSDVAAGVDWLALEQLLTHPRVAAVGEVGLDYYRGGTKKQQLPVLQRFVDLALERKWPMVFHVRSGADADAHADLLDFLQSLPAERCPTGVIHTYSGTAEQAARYLAFGLSLSFSGVVTFKNAEDVAAAARMTPLDRLLIETDCPFLAPAPHRGQRNEPANVCLVAERIAQLKSLPMDDIAAATARNAARLFAAKSPVG